MKYTVCLCCDTRIMIDTSLAIDIRDYNQRLYNELPDAQLSARKYFHALLVTNSDAGSRGSVEPIIALARDRSVNQTGAQVATASSTWKIYLAVFCSDTCYQKAGTTNTKFSYPRILADFARVLNGIRRFKAVLIEGGVPGYTEHSAFTAWAVDNDAVSSASAAVAETHFETEQTALLAGQAGSQVQLKDGPQPILDYTWCETFAKIPAWFRLPYHMSPPKGALVLSGIVLMGVAAVLGWLSYEYHTAKKDPDSNPCPLPVNVSQSSDFIPGNMTLPINCNVPINLVNYLRPYVAAWGASVSWGDVNQIIFRRFTEQATPIAQAWEQYALCTWSSPKLRYLMTTAIPSEANLKEIIALLEQETFRFRGRKT